MYERNVVLSVNILICELRMSLQRDLSAKNTVLISRKFMFAVVISSYDQWPPDDDPNLSHVAPQPVNEASVRYVQKTARKQVA